MDDAANYNTCSPMKGWPINQPSELDVLRSEDADELMRETLHTTQIKIFSSDAIG